MSDIHTQSEDPLANASREEILAALFANMVIQQTNMAMMLLGKVAHPETGQFMQDVESAKMFIDQLEMIEVKTKGNLSREEDGLLKQALAALRMSFVEAIDAPAHPADAPAGTIVSPEEPKTIQPAASAPAPTAAPTPAPAPQPPATPVPPDENRKKFSKKY